MFSNPLARLIMSSVLFLFLIILLEDWFTIELRGFIDRKRNKRSDKNES